MQFGVGTEERGNVRASMRNTDSVPDFADRSFSWRDDRSVRFTPAALIRRAASNVRKARELRRDRLLAGLCTACGECPTELDPGLCLSCERERRLI